MMTWRTTTRNLNPKSLQISIRGHNCIHKTCSTGSVTLHSFGRKGLTLQWQKRKTSFYSSAATNCSNTRLSSSEVLLPLPVRMSSYLETYTAWNSARNSTHLLWPNLSAVKINLIVRWQRWEHPWTYARVFPQWYEELLTSIVISSTSFNFKWLDHCGRKWLG